MGIKSSKIAAVLAVLLLLICARICAQKNYKILNVKSYGATGNGRSDDYQAIQKCFDDAAKSMPCVINFPAGTYKISKTIDIYYTDNSLTIQGEVQTGRKPSIVAASSMSILSVRGYSFDDARGSVTIQNINLQGKHIPYAAGNSFVNREQRFNGIGITDKATATIRSVDIDGIYGEGISITNTRTLTIPDNGRFRSVLIENCRITNCWGYNPKADNYGDGIYIADVASGIIRNNVIVNNVNQTKQLGRVGIVIEYLAQNCLVERNQVSGYDRAIHLEADYGGHTIKNNNFGGSDLGIVVFNKPYPDQRHNNPIKIIGNIISNNGMSKSTRVNRVRHPRSLMNFYAENGCRAGSIIEGNTFKIDGKYAFKSKGMISIMGDGLSLSQNKYSVVNSGLLEEGRVGVYNYSTSVFKKEFFNGVDVHLKIDKNNDSKVIDFKRQNTLLNSAEVFSTEK